MPKMKTKKNVSKHLTARPGGAIKHGQAFKRYILIKRTTKNKRHLYGIEDVHETNLKSVHAMTPYVQS